jgi:hypothetical protein
MHFAIRHRTQRCVLTYSNIRCARSSGPVTPGSRLARHTTQITRVLLRVASALLRATYVYQVFRIHSRLRVYSMCAKSALAIASPVSMAPR